MQQIPFAIQIALLAFVLMAMGGIRPQPDPGETAATPPSIVPYEARFRTTGRTYGANFANRTVSFGFRNFYFSTVGMCSFSSSGQNHVDFSTRAWSRGSDTFKEMLSFHELGHCLLGRAHKNTTYSDGSPDSIMNSWLFSEETYLANRDAYLKELYTAEADWAARAVSRTRMPRHFGGCTFGQ